MGESLIGQAHHGGALGVKRGLGGGRERVSRQAAKTPRERGGVGAGRGLRLSSGTPALFAAWRLGGLAALLSPLSAARRARRPLDDRPPWASRRSRRGEDPGVPGAPLPPPLRAATPMAGSCAGESTFVAVARGATGWMCRYESSRSHSTRASSRATPKASRPLRLHSASGSRFTESDHQGAKAFIRPGARCVRQGPRPRRGRPSCPTRTLSA